ncbi:MucR family transcriptional regulator (plasmid) [Sphingobium sp. V4]|uniref:MucR family transcriptional regulator n=1 Tax=Sphingobium sp. V4 TaxID=3038927 RepID=UPI002557DF89|nr:MucR family transcriptional regulator [Sphingobium sp. V4]WIW90467.1 MucR family transcriptional regulator [Sphingobium sp. V4]
MAEEKQTDITALTVQLLSAYVSRNMVPSEGLADLIKTTRAALVETPTAVIDETASATFMPAVSVRKSLSSPDHILSLIDGKPYKTLKRHLASHDLTPEQYRERYKLPKDYPLVAASYSDARRAVAQKLGLGKKAGMTAVPEKKAAVASPDVAKASSTPPTAVPTKADGAPTKRTAGKIKGDPAVSVEAAPQPAAKPSAPKKDKRARLSITGPKESQVVSEAKSAAAAAKSKPARKKPAASPKAKPTSKPKFLKAALAVAGTHLGGETKSDPSG